MAYSSGVTNNRGGDGYRGPNPSGGQTAPLFQDTSGMPSFPHVGTAQQLLSNPMVTQAAVNYGQGLVDIGQSYIDRSVGRFAPGLKLYFAVDTNYVLHKLWILLLPYSHKDWSVQYSSEQIQPKQDVNVPDLYIPTMSFVTYILLTGLVLGTQNRFSPEHLGMNASSLLAWLVAEVLLIWLSFFLARVTSQLSWLDILAYCSYKYVSMIVSVTASIIGGSTAYYIALIWTTMAIAYFEVQTLRLRVQPDVTVGASRTRNYLLLVIAILQPLLVLWLTWSLVMHKPPPSIWQPPAGFQ